MIKNLDSLILGDETINFINNLFKDVNNLENLQVIHYFLLFKINKEYQERKRYIRLHNFLGDKS
jgi:hypothetical protein